MKRYTRIGNRELIFSERVIAADGELVTLGVTIDNWDLELRIQFLTTLNKETKIEVEATDYGASIKFENWKSALGLATAKPMEFAGSDRGIIYFQAAHWYLSGTNILDIQLQIEAL